MGTARKEGKLRRASKALVILFLLILLFRTPFGAGDEGIEGGGPSRGDVPDDAIKAFSGVHRVSDFASTVIYGEELWQRGRLGHYSWTGDVNGDGLNDLVVAAPGAPGVGGYEDEGRIYIFYGQNGTLPKVIDLNMDEPDVLLISNNTWFQKQPPAPPYPVLAYLTNEFDVGDFDGDGLTDILIAVPGTDLPVWGVIIYGRVGGFPEKLIVHLQKYSVLTADQEEVRYLWLNGFGFAEGQDNLVLPNYMVTADLDNDGADEVISGAPIGVRILWGGTTTWTTIYGRTAYDHFGRALDLGDVDGDGTYDLLIGAPLADDPVSGKIDCGAAYAVFNASSLKGMTSLSITVIARPSIYGSSDKDLLGKTVMLSDVDGDGMDDLVLAAPDADDGTSVHECGRVYAFRGGANTTFPARMVSDDSAHWTLIGNRGKVTGTNDYPGDRLGTVMDAGDVDGDGREEVVIGTYSAASTLSEPLVVDNVGKIAVYEPTDLFPTGGAIQRLERTGGSLVIEGDEMRDTLGWQMFLGDVTNDGVDDILVGAPGADGPENLRTSDGEAYIIEGSSTKIGDLAISGAGFSEPYLLAGGPDVRISADLSLSGKGRNASDCWLSLRSGGLSSKLLVGPEGLIGVDGPDGLTPIESGCGLDRNNGVVEAYWSFTLDWTFMMEGPLNATIVLRDSDGRSFYREYPSAVLLTKDVVLKGELNVRDAAGPLAGIGEWVLPGQTLTFSGPRAVYSRAEDVEIPFGALDLVLNDALGTIVAKGYDPMWSYVGTTPDSTSWDLTLALGFPGSGPKPADMDLYGSRTFRINIDTEPPQSPTGVRAISANNGLPVYDRMGQFDVAWNGSIGPELDPGGSGVKEFQVLESGLWRPVIGDVGLTATYYRGKAFEEMAFQRTDIAINFTIRDWGPFGPDPTMVRFDDFSVRWHGYLVPKMNGSYLFSLKGSGSVMAKLNGKALITRTSIQEDVEATLPFLIEGSVNRLEVYFGNELPSSHISLDVWDPAYRKLGKDEMPFSRPVNATVVKLDQWSSAGPSVRSLDWTGRVSEGTGAEAHKDAQPPVIVPGWVAEWHNTTTPTLRATVAVLEGRNGSGIDKGSFAYSFEREGLPKGQWETGDLKYQLTEQDAMGALRANLTVRPYLEEGWKGTIRFTAADLAGNRGFSDPVWLGIDMDPPEIALLSPIEGKVLYGAVQNLTVSFFDGSGSGPEGASLEVRSNTGGAGWTGWSSIGPVPTDRPDVFRGKVVLTVGRHEVQFRGRDLAGNPAMSEAYVMDIMEPPVNRPPIPNIAHPPNGTKFFSGQIIELSATGTWDDGLGPYESTLLSWYSSRDGYLGQGALVKTQLSVGRHNITLFADDGAPGHNMSRTVSIEVLDWNAPVPDDDSPEEEELIDPLSIFALAALLIVVLVLLVFVIIERRSGPKDPGAYAGPVGGTPPDKAEE